MRQSAPHTTSGPRDGEHAFPRVLEAFGNAEGRAHHRGDRTMFHKAARAQRKVPDHGTINQKWETIVKANLQLK